MENFSLKWLKRKVVHFIGIGGISMSALALMLKANGVFVQGSDETENDEVKKLKKKGVNVFVGHKKSNLKNVDAVVYTSAICDDNEELVEAKKRKLVIIKRSELLGMVAENYKIVISVAGSHGKTTAAAMIAEMMIDAGLKPTVHIGGVVNSLKSNHLIGSKKFFVTESCEYKDNYLFLSPDISVILNIDGDHLDYFGSVDGVKKSFLKFASLTKQGGVNVACADNENSKEILKLENTVSFGLDESADVYAKNIKEYKACHYSFDVFFSGCRLGNIRLDIIGRHNVYNALATIVVGIALGVEFCEIKKSIEKFSGVKRRCQKISCKGGVLVYHDYAHHPKQIESMLKVANTMAGRVNGKVIAVFEPHTYSRTKFLINEFSRSFVSANHVIFAPVYSARELPVMGYDSLKLAAETKKFNKNVEYLETYKEIFVRVKELARPNDVVMILGAGTIDKLADMFE